MPDRDGSELTPRVREWLRRGERAEVAGHRVYVQRRHGGAPPIVLLHGFPSSSYDWRRLLEVRPAGAALAFDFLGFGLSDKPRRHEYSLFAQADLTEEVVGRAFGSEPVLIVAHDMGTSVATELMARELEGTLGIGIAGALLFNGSIILERSRPTFGQRLLRGRAGPVAARLMNERFFRRQFGSIFSPEHPLDRDEAEDQWLLIAHRSGHRLGHRLVRYMDERVEHAARWHGALREWPRPLALLWGLRDPVAVPDVLEGLRELRPAAPVTELPDVGHYPQIEAPERLAGAIEALAAQLA